MKFRFFLCLLFLSSTVMVDGKNLQAFDKAAFYTALSSESVEVINAQILLVKGSSIEEKSAYEGALLMKKAGVIKGTAKEKLNLFKAGHSKLESAIAKDNNNIEYRFLRLIIQEHAPKIVKYRSQIETDSQLVRTNFRNLPPFLQQVITDYSKSSKALKIG